MHNRRIYEAEANLMSDRGDIICITTVVATERRALFQTRRECSIYKIHFLSAVPIAHHFAFPSDAG